MDDVHLCPISQEIMRDPVIAADGHSYERREIENWLLTSDMSPMTGAKLPSKILIPNHTLRQSIEQAVSMQIGSGHVSAPAQPRVQISAPQLNPASDLRVTVTPVKNAALIGLTLPAGLPAKPLCLIAILDVSGSMCLPAQDGGGENAAASFSRLDLVKHSMKTAVELLRPSDSLMIITFSDAAETKLDFTVMDAQGKRSARAAIDRMIAAGSTNLWGGLAMAIEKAQQGAAGSDAHTALLLLTDGEPTAAMSPPRGITSTLERTLSAIPKGLFTIHTVGFGYGKQLDSPLLREIARQANGCYSYVPDGSMVGTVFIHFFCNLMSVVLPSVIVEVRPTEPSIMLESYVFHVGYMRAAQTRDLYIPYTGTSSKPNPIEVVSVQNCGRYASKVLCQPPIMDVHFQSLRQRFVDTIHAAMESAVRGEESVAADLIRKLDDDLKPYSKDTNIVRLREDLIHSSPDRGQILKAIQFWNKWGQHYLPSVWFSHTRQEKTNFKDRSMEMYSTVELNAMIDSAEETFKRLPAPAASIKASQASSSATNVPVDMSRLIDRTGGCFTSSSLVTMADGSSKRVAALVKGDAVKGGIRVRCLVRFGNTEVDEQLVVFRPRQGTSTLGITAWHPVMNENGAWEFPCESSRFVPSLERHDAVYNVLLEIGGSSIEINGIACVTLNHGLRAPVAAHPYFGTYAVERDLMAFQDEFEHGYVAINRPNFLRDPQSQLVCKVVDESSLHALTCPVSKVDQMLDVFPELCF